MELVLTMIHLNISKKYNLFKIEPFYFIRTILSFNIIIYVKNRRRYVPFYL